jgi:hypothetical protein
MILLVMRVYKAEAPLECVAMDVIMDSVVKNMDSHTEVEFQQGHEVATLTTSHGVGEVEDLQVLTKTDHPVVAVVATMMEHLFQGNCLNSIFLRDSNAYCTQGGVLQQNQQPQDHSIGSVQKNIPPPPPGPPPNRNGNMDSPSSVSASSQFGPSSR